MRESKDIRLFFALWPDEGIREQMAAWLKPFPSDRCRLVPRYNWHMTLHFVGNTTFAEKNCLDRQAKKLRARPFELSIDATGYFKKPRVLWLGCQRPPDALFDLQRNLGNRISRCEYRPEKRSYSPHITVARKCIGEPVLKPGHPIVWRVNQFVLVESVSQQAGGVRYHITEDYPLG